jgi:uncharacterized lipoprotein YddW (UPF0748 family)
MKLKRILILIVPLFIILLLTVGKILIDEGGNFERFLAQVSGKPINETRGIWLTDTDSVVLRDASKMDDVLTDLKNKGFNTIYPDIWGKGVLFYDGENGSSSLKKTETSIYRDPSKYKGDFLAALSRSIVTKHRDMKLVPWLEYGLMVPPKSDIAVKNPHWLLADKNGSKTTIASGVQMSILNPLRPEVGSLFRAIIRDLYVNYAIDGISFDDQLSWPASMSYDDSTVQAYLNETKKPIPPNGDEPAFLKWKSEKLTAFIKNNIVGGLKDAMTYTRMPTAEARGLDDPTQIKQQRKRPFITISQNSYPWCYVKYAQDWPSWLSQNLFDEFTVQIYDRTIEGYAKTLDGQMKHLDKFKGKIPITTAVLAGVDVKINDFNTVAAQIRYNRSKGLSGFGVFYYESYLKNLPLGTNTQAMAPIMSQAATPVLRKL